MQEIKHNIEKLELELSSLLQNLGRERSDVTLIAVTKTHPCEAIEAVFQCGITEYGENKVQEAMRKVPMLSSGSTGFHFIGHLQSNKINQLLSLKPKLIHSIDSLYLAEKLNRALGNRNITLDILVQVNVTEEDSKSGVTFDNAEETIWKIASFANLRVRGLMTIGKLHPNPEISRPYFKQLKELFDKIKAQQVEVLDLSWLSMGMSHDWKIAVAEGSNMIRIGSAIFGERYYGEDR
ncbi:MAG: YggS family pyridoxal phosphate-dependent enzyme [Candidatus Cloacimonetes bacterium]|nr:YggS family pyridoxal phosphate-dependent enzyme [Candidatus Cloacimonadota bacterium]